MEAGALQFAQPKQAEQLSTQPQAVTSEALLFTTATCPNCRVACRELDKAGIAYRKVLAEEEEELVRKFGIHQAPTLVLQESDTVSQYVGVSKILGMIRGK